MTKEEAIAFRKLVLAGSASMTDKEVSTAPDVLPRMYYTGELISNGTRINWNGTIKRAAVDLWDREENNPDNVPTLWKISPIAAVSGSSQRQSPWERHLAKMN